MRMLIAAAIMIVGTSAAIGPVDPHHDPNQRWVCSFGGTVRTVVRNTGNGDYKTYTNVTNKCYMSGE